MLLRVNKAGVEADTGSLEAEGLPQLQQVEVDEDEEEGEADTEAPGEAGVAEYPGPGGARAGDSEMKN